MELVIDKKIISKKVVGSDFAYIYKFGIFIEKGDYEIKIVFEKE